MCIMCMSPKRLPVRSSLPIFGRKMAEVKFGFKSTVSSQTQAPTSISWSTVAASCVPARSCWSAQCFSTMLYSLTCGCMPHSDCMPRSPSLNTPDGALILHMQQVRQHPGYLCTRQASYSNGQKERGRRGGGAETPSCSVHNALLGCRSRCSHSMLAITMHSYADHLTSQYAVSACVWTVWCDLGKAQ